MAHNDPVFSLLKGLEILKAVGATEEGLRLSDIAQQMGWKVPATHHLVRTLVMASFLEKDRDGRYRLGTALCHLGEQALRSPRNTAVEGALMFLHGRYPTGTIIYGHPFGAELRQSRRMSPDRPGVIQRLSTDTLHPYASAGGLLALAHATADERVTLEGARPFAEHGQSLWKSMEKMEAFLARARKTIRVESPFQSDLYLRLAVGMVGTDGTLSAILGISLPRSSDAVWDKEAVVADLSAQVTRIEQNRI